MKGPVDTEAESDDPKLEEEEWIRRIPPGRHAIGLDCTCPGSPTWHFFLSSRGFRASLGMTRIQAYEWREQIIGCSTRFLHAWWDIAALGDYEESPQKWDKFNDQIGMTD